MPLAHALRVVANGNATNASTGDYRLRAPTCNMHYCTARTRIVPRGQGHDQFFIPVPCFARSKAQKLASSLVPRDQQMSDAERRVSPARRAGPSAVVSVLAWGTGWSSGRSMAPFSMPCPCHGARVSDRRRTTPGWWRSIAASPRAPARDGHAGTSTTAGASCPSSQNIL